MEEEITDFFSFSEEDLDDFSYDRYKYLDVYFVQLLRFIREKVSIEGFCTIENEDTPGI